MVISQGSPKGALLEQNKELETRKRRERYVDDDDFWGFLLDFGGPAGRFSGFRCIRKRNVENVRKTGSTP
jgi:hypothetical protein